MEVNRFPQRIGMLESRKNTMVGKMRRRNILCLQLRVNIETIFEYRME